MRDFLLDTDVISMFAPGRQPVAANVTRWVETQSTRFFFSSVSVGEIEAGLCKLRREGASARAAQIDTWWQRVVDLYERRIIAFDRNIATTYGSIFDRAIGAGHKPSFPDAAIAATAAKFDLQVVTCNIRHFRFFGVPYTHPEDLA